MSLLEELRDESKTAWDAKEAVRLKWEVRKRELEAKMSEQLKAELGYEYNDAQEAYRKADFAWRRERDRVNVQDSSAQLPFPEGTVMLEWQPSSWLGRHCNFRKTGKRAVLQVFRKGDHKATTHKCRSIDAGTVIVRFLKADGKPGLMMERYSGGRWLPEGAVHPDCATLMCPSCGDQRPADGLPGKNFEPGSKCPKCGHIEPKQEG